METLEYTWEEYTNDIKIISEMISKIPNPHLLCLYRGSLPMGTHLSNKLSLPLSIVDFQTRDGDTNITEPKLIKNAGICATDTLVIIDDIFDKGLTIAKTREFLYKKFPHIRLKQITLFRNSHMIHLHDNYNFDVKFINESRGQWIEFPWEG